LENGFSFGEFTKGGVVEGYTKTCRIAILTTTSSEQSYSLILAISRTELADRQYCEGVAKSIYSRIIGCEESKLDKETQMGTRVLDLERKLLPIAAHLEYFPPNDLNPHYFHAALLCFQKKGYKLSTYNDANHIALFAIEEKVPKAILVYERRLFKDYVKGESLALLAELERKEWQGTMYHFAIVVCIAGPRGEGMTAIYASTTNAGDHGKLPIDITGIAAAVGKMVFE
jgi:hypothetical protein